jgi:hypothetical protein
VGRRSRRRAAGSAAAGPAPRAPVSDYADQAGNSLSLRGSLSPGSRREYATALAGSLLSREDAEQRALEMLFERLAVRWRIAGVDTEGQRELLGRLRLASPAERQWVRETLRAHCAECFPDVQVP